MSSAAAIPAPRPPRVPSPVSDPTALDTGTMERLLREISVDQAGDPWHVRVVDTTGSTNSDLLAAVRANGFGGPTLLVAAHQTAGRGRLGRVWQSAAGASLTASVALRIARPMSALDGVTLACGLAVRDAIALHGVDAGLKWPNDLLVDGAKLAGILVEALPVVDGTVLVVGVGVNVEQAGATSDGGPGALAATDLRTAGGVALDRNRLATELALALQARLAAFATRGFAASFEEWNRRDAFRDQAVSLKAIAGECVFGIERGVDANGALLIDTANGRRRIVSGDVSLRSAAAR